MQNRSFTHNPPSMPERTKKALFAFKYACDAFHDQSFRDQGNYYPIPTVMFMDGRQFNTKPMLAMSEVAGIDRCVVYNTKNEKTLLALFLKEVEAYNAFKVQMEAQAETFDSGEE